MSGRFAKGAFWWAPIALPILSYALIIVGKITYDLAWVGKSMSAIYSIGDVASYGYVAFPNSFAILIISVIGDNAISYAILGVLNILYVGFYYRAMKNISSWRMVGGILFLYISASIILYNISLSLAVPVLFGGQA